MQYRSISTKYTSVAVEYAGYGLEKTINVK